MVPSRGSTIQRCPTLRGPASLGPSRHLAPPPAVSPPPGSDGRGGAARITSRAASWASRSTWLTKSLWAFLPGSLQPDLAEVVGGGPRRRLPRLPGRWREEDPWECLPQRVGRRDRSFPRSRGFRGLGKGGNLTPSLCPVRTLSDQIGSTQAMSSQQSEAGKRRDLEWGSTQRGGPPGELPGGLPPMGGPPGHLRLPLLHRGPACHHRAV